MVLFYIFSSNKEQEMMKLVGDVQPHKKIVIIVLEARDFLDFVTLWHFGSCNCGIPPQSLLFPIIDIASTFFKNSNSW